MADDEQAALRRERFQARLIVGVTMAGVLFVAILAAVLLVKAVW